MLRIDKDLISDFEFVDINLNKVDEINYDFFNKKILIITSKSFISNGVIDRLCNNLDTAHFEIFSQVKANPDIEDIQNLIRKYKDYKP